MIVFLRMQVVRETNGYVMEGRTLKCHLVRPDQIHPELFRNAHRKFVKIDWNKV